MATTAKPDTPSYAHLDWLIRSREANQRASLELHKLVGTHSSKIKKKKPLSVKAQVLTSVAFSLWRAAFLADKTGTHAATIEDAHAFLGKMLTDNAITYPQDRASREWTYNYYMEAARHGLQILAKNWLSVEATLSQKTKVKKGSTLESRRWDKYQATLNAAINEFKGEL